MKKILTCVVSIVLILAMCFAAGCDSFGGNYVEANDEQKTAAYAKIEEVVSKAEENVKTVTTKISVDLSIKYNDEEGTIKGSAKIIDDKTDSEAELLYASVDLSSKGKDTEATIKGEGYADYKNDKAYITLKNDAKYMGEETHSSSKYIALADAIDEITDATKEMGPAATYIDMATDISELLAAFGADGVKVYVDGENKIKVEAKIMEGVNITVYFVIEDNIYKAKSEMVFDMSTEASTYMPAMTIKGSVTVEVLTNADTVKLPNANGYYDRTVETK